jgi:predicted  nucleic acid-binding Zn-ribbon protein
MNHLGDTNKMVSRNPRMDASAHDDGAIWQTGCDIERELNAATSEIEEKRKDVVWLATEKAKSENYVTELENRLRALWDKYDGDRKHYMDRIKRLEEAGIELRECASWVGHACCQYVDQIRRAKAAIEAWDKEAKL